MKKHVKVLSVLLVCLFLFGSYYLLRETYSTSITDEVIVFDYSLDVSDDEKIIKNLTIDTVVSDIIKKVSVTSSDSTSVIVTDSSGIQKNATDVIASGDILSISADDGSVVKYNLSVMGDANGDGKISLVDLVQLRKHIVGWENSETGNIERKSGVYYYAIDMNNDGEVSLVDLVRVRKTIVGLVEPSFIKFKSSKADLTVNSTLELEYFITPSNVNDTTVTWSSSDTSVVTVDKGVVKALKVGTATITAKTSNGMTATCEVTVKKLENPMLKTVIEPNIDKLRDPSVLVDNGAYYVYGTGWVAYKNDSGSLDGSWEKIGMVVTKESHMSADFWAPEVYKYKDAYYMFATYKSSVTGHRGTSVMCSDSPEGPFVEISDGHVTPDDWDSIDGTLYIDDDGQPWMIFVHEWTSTSDSIGRMAAAKLSDDLTSFISEPVELFKATDASWVGYTITDGCWMYKTEDGQLLMLWSNLDSSKGYAVGIARSKDGTVTGKWTHDSTLLYSKAISGKYDGGHGMIFTDTNGQMYLSIHSPNTATTDRKEKPTFIPIYETNGTLKIVK